MMIIIVIITRRSGNNIFVRSRAVRRQTNSARVSSWAEQEKQGFTRRPYSGDTGENFFWKFPRANVNRRVGRTNITRTLFYRRDFTAQSIPSSE